MRSHARAGPREDEQGLVQAWSSVARGPLSPSCSPKGPIMQYVRVCEGVDELACVSMHVYVCVKMCVPVRITHKGAAASLG